MAVVPTKGLLFCPCLVAVSPAHGIESGSVAGVPEMDADGLIGAVPRNRGLPRNRGMVVGDVTVETTIPAGLEADVRVIHGLQVECVDRSFPPNVSEVIVDDLGNRVVNVDVEYVPLFKRQSETYLQAQWCTYSSGLVSRKCYSGYWGSIFGVDGDNVSDISPLPGSTKC